MQPITFPDDGMLLRDEAAVKGPEHEAHRKTRGQGSIKYGEKQEIIFRDGGILSHDNNQFFAQPLPQGYFGQSTILFSAPASHGTKPISLRFQDERDRTEHTFQLDLV